MTLRGLGLGSHKGQEHDYASRPQAREGLLRSRQAPRQPSGIPSGEGSGGLPHCQRWHGNAQKKMFSRRETWDSGGLAVSRGLNLILFLKRFGFQIGAWVEEKRLNIEHTFPHFGALP